MREYLDKWKKSAKYAEFQNLLAAKKQRVAELKFRVMDKEEQFTKEELLEVIRLIKECNQQIIDEEFDFDYSYFNIIGDADTIYIEYVGRIASWSMYLGNALIEEDYEFASEIRDVIQIEKSQFIDSINKHRQDILLREEDFFERIEGVDEKFLKKITNTILGEDEQTNK